LGHNLAVKKILVPIDFSPVNREVVAAAVALAKACDGRLTLMHVVTQPSPMIDYGFASLDLSDLIVVLQKSAERNLAEWRKRLLQRGIGIKTSVAVGLPAVEIADAARKLGADYIVLGSHGHTAFYDLLIGSTASGVLKKAPCPVVIVPIPGK
jgi:nucleotide-binding universal stress UspA family protein